LGDYKAMDILLPEIVEILQDYVDGMSFTQLANKYFLLKKVFRGLYDKRSRNNFRGGCRLMPILGPDS
jgi:hypothetical protein